MSGSAVRPSAHAPLLDDLIPVVVCKYTPPNNPWRSSPPRIGSHSLMVCCQWRSQNSRVKICM